MFEKFFFNLQCRCFGHRWNIHWSRIKSKCVTLSFYFLLSSFVDFFLPFGEKWLLYFPLRQDLLWQAAQLHYRSSLCRVPAPDWDTETCRGVRNDSSSDLCLLSALLDSETVRDQWDVEQSAVWAEYRDDVHTLRL